MGFGISAITVAAMRRRLLAHLVEEEGPQLRTNIKDLAALARGVGVDVGVLQEAVRLARMAHANDIAAVHYLKIKSPLPIRRHVLAAGVHYGFTIGDYATFFRSFYHAVMQTSAEPHVRGQSLRRYRDGLRRYGVALDPHPKSHRVKPIPLDQFASRMGGKTPTETNQQVYVSNGLYQALKERARAYGKTVATYCLLWLLDAIDGILPKTLVLEPVRLRDLYPLAENYVLPVKRPAALPEERNDP